ncbi:MAG: tRNA (adenosine(37)-N6)-threonylcarbamoyltransferase complex ATPase subunit type 1 TsaE [Chloroflexi bacterium]|jgi:tRNA threonylcarbamoyladenosine biosynthesis protein TsaE|nr:tRNA (adenosine(37)-N6)-threonylcarbamoyltransferase complex ATPase subunit type 1 TsaE [Chloroflexota bacterium]
MAILKPNAFEFFSHSADQTRRLGVRLGAMLPVGTVICLEGDLGSGKTTLVQGIAQGWGSTDRVTSPTFVILNQYRRPDGMQLYHADAYRLAENDPLDLAILDIEQALENGVLIVEWADRLKESLPKEHIWIQMQWTGPQSRHFILTPEGKQNAQILKKLQHAIYGV